jgi:PST family polysaccharide transporter
LSTEFSISSLSTTQQNQAENLGQKTFQGFAWMLLSSFGTKVITLGCQLVLAWILLPQDFGLVALAYSVTAFTAVIQRNGLREILIQRAPRFSEYANSAFWLSLVIGFIVALLTLGAAPVAAHFYKQPDLIGILSVLALGQMLLALQSVPGAKLQIDLRFRELSLVNFFEGIATGLLTVAFALAGWKAYSIVLPIPLVQLASFLIQMRWSGFRPQFGYHWPLWREMIGASSLLLGAGLLYAFNMQGANIVLGLFHGPVVVGIFFFAYNLCNQINSLLTNNLYSVLLPTLSNLQGDLPRQTQAFLRVTRLMNLAGMFVCFLLAAVADPLIRALYGEKWVPAIPSMQVLSLGMTFSISFALSINLMTAQGLFKELLYFNIFRAVGFITLVAIGARLGGALAVSIASAIFTLLFGPTITYIAIRPGGYGWLEIVRGHASPFLIGATACGMAVFLSSYIPEHSEQIWLWVRVGAIGSMSGLFWLLLCRWLQPEAWHECTQRIAQTLTGLSRKTA